MVTIRRARRCALGERPDFRRELRSPWRCLNQKCMSCSQVKPMPPCICTALFVARAYTSANRAFAIDAARDASLLLFCCACAAYQSSDRDGSISAKQSAAMCFTAWKLPIGRPNCSRIFAKSTAISRARSAPPWHSAAIATEPTSSIRWRGFQVAPSRPILWSRSTTTSSNLISNKRRVVSKPASGVTERPTASLGMAKRLTPSGPSPAEVRAATR